LGRGALYLNIKGADYKPSHLLTYLLTYKYVTVFASDKGLIWCAERPVSPGVKKEEQDVKTTVADRLKPTAVTVVPRCTVASVPRNAVSLPTWLNISITPLLKYVYYYYYYYYKWILHQKMKKWS